MKKNILKAENIAFSSHPKPLARLTIAITGVTGLLGRNLFFEIIKNHLQNLDDIEIIVFGRSTINESLCCRMKLILVEDGLSYLNIETRTDLLVDSILSRVFCVEYELSSDILLVSDEDFEILKKKEINYFFHLASLSDFRSTPLVIQTLNQVNIEGTKRILDLVSALNVQEFIYSSSAYGAGLTQGIVYPDEIRYEIQFRNHYEYTKIEVEKYIKNFKVNNKPINYKIFRLTGIGGRLIEQPLGQINKYDIFYGWAKYFLNLKYQKLDLTTDEIFNAPLKIPIRIVANTKSGMNVVPVDYAAKLMYYITHFDESRKSYHLVNDIDIPHVEHLAITLNALNITGWQIVDNTPESLNDAEKIYYRSVGKLFTPYVISDDIIYDISSIKPIRKKMNLKCPLMTEKKFKILIDYAKGTFFGLFDKKIIYPYHVTTKKAVTFANQK